MTTLVPEDSAPTAAAVPAAPAAAARENPRRGTSPARRPRGWAAAGVLAGATGTTGIAASTAVSAVYEPELAGDADGIVARLAEQTPQILLFHTATLVSVVLLVVFAAGLQRRLAAGAPSGSLLPAVVASGLGLVAVAGLMGTALTTEFAFGLQEPALLVPETAVMFGHWVGTVAWLWVGAGLSALAVAVASLRHGAVPRWIGWTSAVLGLVVLLVGVSPLQYMAGMVGPLWLLATAAGFLAGDRRA